MTLRNLIPAILLAAAGTASAGDQAPVAPDAHCKAVPGFAALAARFPGYAMPADVDSPVAVALPFAFRPDGGTLRRARRSTVCIAVAVDAAGKPGEAAIYEPARGARLSPEERRTLMASKFMPARKDGQPVNAVFVLPVSAD